MEDSIVLVHAGLAVLFFLMLIVYGLYHIIRCLVAKENGRQQLGKRWALFFKFLLGAILLSGVYPLVVLQRVELYHLLKLLALAAIWYLLLAQKSLKLSYGMGLTLMLLIFTGYSSFVDAPKFPKPNDTADQLVANYQGLSELERGKVIFENRCALCHGSDGKLGKFQAADLTKSELSYEQKLSTVTNGSPLTVMASFKDVLSEEEIILVTQYVETLKD